MHRKRNKYLLTKVTGGSRGVLWVNWFDLQHHELSQLLVCAETFKRHTPVVGCRDICSWNDEHKVTHTKSKLSFASHTLHNLWYRHLDIFPTFFSNSVTVMINWQHDFVFSSSVCMMIVKLTLLYYTVCRWTTSHVVEVTN